MGRCASSSGRSGTRTSRLVSPVSPRVRGDRLVALRRADALLAWEQHREIPAAGLSESSRLRLVQFLSAGVDAVDFSALPERLAVASNAGAYAGAVSEHAVAMT